MPADPLATHVTQQFKHDAPLISCRFDPTGQYVFVGAQDNLVLRWELTSGTKTAFKAHDSWVRSLGFSVSGDVLVTGGYDGRLIWWPTAAAEPTPLRTVDAHAGWIRALAVSPNGEWLATCGNDLKVKLWRMSDGGLIREFAGHERHVYHVAFHPDGQQLASGDLVGKFIHWNAQSGEQVRQFTVDSLTKFDKGFIADYGGPHCLAFTPDGKRLLAGGITNVTNAFAGVGNPIVVEIDWNEAKVATTHLTKANLQGVAWGLVWHPDGYVIVALGGHAGGKLGFWKPDEKDEFHQMNVGNNVRDLTLHPDGLQLAAPFHDGQCRLLRMTPK